MLENFQTEDQDIENGVLPDDPAANNTRTV